MEATERLRQFLSYPSAHTNNTLENLGVNARWVEEQLVFDMPYVVDPTTPFSPALIAKLAEDSITWSTQMKIPRFGIKQGLKGLPAVKNVICVASGKGGVGKSSVAANLAFALQALGARTGLLDADIYGPSVPKMLGLSQTKAEVEDKLLIPVFKGQMPTMSIGYLVDEKAPMVWRGPMVSSALSQLMNETAWPELDYLIVDCPPGTGDIALTLSQKTPMVGALIVTTPQEVATIDAQKALNMFTKVDAPVLGVVENMSYFSCGNCSERHTLFGEGGGKALADEAGVPLLGQIPFMPLIGENADKGLVSPETTKLFREIALKLVENLALLPRDYAINTRTQIVT